MRELERRSAGPRPELRDSDRDGIGRIFGYGAVFNSLSEDLGGFREVIRPGAFDVALERADLDVMARLEHKGGLDILGRTSAGTLEVGVDERGLWYSVDLPDTNTGRDVRELIRRGDIAHSSFAFHLAAGGDEMRTEDGGIVRYVHEIEQLVDVAPVSQPAYARTVVEARSVEMAASIAAAAVESQREAIQVEERMLGVLLEIQSRV